jgi:hypothetical protein
MKRPGWYLALLPDEKCQEAAVLWRCKCGEMQTATDLPFATISRIDNTYEEKTMGY